MPGLRLNSQTTPAGRSLSKSYSQFFQSIQRPLAELQHSVPAGGGITPDEVRHVMDRQPSRGEWLEGASWVIDNSGDDQDLAEQCRRVWAEIAPD